MTSTAIENKKAELYDYPQYYDAVFGSDWKSEFDFLKACFQMHALRKVRHVFEPACGTGRLLFRFAMAGFEVSGIDLSSKAIDYCNRRLRRRGFREKTWLGDMAEARLESLGGLVTPVESSLRRTQPPLPSELPPEMTMQIP